MIFVNYRRDDSTAMAGRLYDRLGHAFGRNNLFMDVDHIPPGVDFVEHLNNQVAACDVFIAVIGPNWLNARNEKGERRLFDPDDFVAIEIAAALARDIRVIPVLVDDARMPKASELPESLKPLSRRQAIDLRHTHFGRDAEALIERIKEAFRGPVRFNRWRAAAATGAALLVLAGIGLYVTGMPVSLPGAVQPDTREQAEKARLAAVQAEEERKARAAAEAEAKAKAEQAEKERLAAAKAEEERNAKAAAETQATTKAEQAEKETQVTANSEQAGDRSPEDKMGRFVSKVLGATEVTWKQIFAADGKTYRAPILVLYHTETRADCGGVAQSRMGPFYCPSDQKIYLDTSFFDQIASRLGCNVGSNACPFAQAYMIAHEVGHHVQNLLGILPRAQEVQRMASSKAAANYIQLQVELQADCLAGLWANRENKMLRSEGKPPFVEPGDVEAVMRTASAIGDDTLQKRAQGSVVPDSFTHGSAQQRQRWFNAGLQSGTVASCNTFAATQL